ncbi:Arylsulfatase [Rubripirellula amarantea]|uniref:Arylsulfatase n=1 Tax=Rubripirellula amarantea TaxID=2527999 RepID=A0A5C5WM51_9BACT|nr:sulfatase [Rubripirellula amarantea]TWT51219.1 Arylsulfatase [Rubripirellula amarantea]
MIRFLTLVLVAFAFVLPRSACKAEIASTQRPNVLLICVDDLRPELACYGASHIDSPNIDRLASQGRLFQRHYVQAPTCGASRYALLTGTYGPAGNEALFSRAKQLSQSPDSVNPSMPAWFRDHGYTTVSVGKVSHHPGGRGGQLWNDDSILEMPHSWDRHLLPAGPWKHPMGWMHGLADGEIRKSAGEMDVYQSADGDDETYPDGISVNESLRQLDLLASDGDQPFFLAVGILRPHLPFGAPAKYMRPYVDRVFPPTPHPAKPEGKTTWHGSGEFMKYNRWGQDPNTDASFAMKVRKHYAACVTYADAQVGRVLDKLESTGASDNTVVVLWGDHGWHLGEHAIWGKHSLFEESLRSPLIIRSSNVHRPGVPADAVVETIDLFPTLCELVGIDAPDYAEGISLQASLRNPSAQGHVAVSYHHKASTIRTDRYRLVVHQDGFHELYDHEHPAKETINVATANPKLVTELSELLGDRLEKSR